MKKEVIKKVKVQEKCNEYIRLRDAGKPCISCGKYNTLQAGHYWPVGGYDGLRFDELNINGECAYCNAWDKAHLIGYRKNLIKKIGLKSVEALDERAADYKKNGRKFSKSELLEIYNYYCEKIKQLKSEL